MKRTNLTIALIVVLALMTGLSAQDRSGIELIGQVYTYWSTAYGVTVDGHYAYLATNNTGLQIVDISDLDNLQLVGAYDTPHRAQNVVIEGDIAYVADGESGLRILNISDPAHPVEIGFSKITFLENTFRVRTYSVSWGG